jgi:hypothetical protein
MKPAANIQQKLCIEGIKQAFWMWLVSVPGGGRAVADFGCAFHGDRCDRDPIESTRGDALNAFGLLAGVCRLATDATRCFL